MSINGSRKESIFSIYLKENANLLSNALSLDLEYIALEQPHANRKIDISAVDSKRRIPVYVEVQLTHANISYLNRIKEMLESFNEAVIVWIAGSFEQEIIMELKEWLIVNQKMYVDFYAVSLHKEVLTVLQNLNELYNLDIYKNFYLLNDLDPLLKIELISKRIPPTHCGQLNANPIPFDFNRPEDVKRALLHVLRERIPYYLNFHYDKKTNQYDRILSVGAGKSGLTYRCSAKDARSLAFVELYFDESKIDWYEALKKIKQELYNTIHKDLCFNKRRIGVYFKPEENYEQTFVKIADVFQKMIDGFSPYIYEVKKLPVRAIAITPNKFVQVPIELPEQPFPTEDSFRIEMEELSELLLTK